MGNTTQKESEIIIKNSVEEMAKLFVKEYIIVWHDPNIDSPENSDYIQDLRKISEVKTFSDWEEASNYVQSIEKICNVITSGKNGEVLVKDIANQSNVLGFYVFCGNIEFHSQWAQYYAKVMCVEDDMNNILAKLKKVLLEWQKEESSLRIGFPAFAPIFDDMDKSENNYLHLKLKGLVNFKNREQAKHDFVSLSRIIYNEESHIKDFQKDYNQYKMEKVFEWYTKDCFLYKVLNNCLRIATSDSIQYCRLILKDLETAIKERYRLKSHSLSGLLYRGTYLSRKEWAILQDNVGKDIEMYGFLSTSKLKSVGEEFVLKGDTSSKALITILVPGCPNEGEQGFAEVKEFSEYAEEEVLFNVRSRFTILETGSEIIEGKEYRHLVLLYGARIWRQHLSEAESDKYQFEFEVKIVCRQCNEATEMLFASLKEKKDNKKYVCQKCLPNFLEKNNGPLLCIPLTREGRIIKLRGKVMPYPDDFRMPFYGYACVKCQTTKSKWYYSCVDCQEELKTIWCSECIHHEEACLHSSGHAVILETVPFSFWSEKLSEDELNHIEFQNQLVGDEGLFQQANIFYDCNELEKAKEFYKKFIGLTEKNPSSEDQAELAVSYNNLGLIYGELGEYKAALENHFKALKIKEQVFMENHPSTALSHNNIGSAYQNLKEYQRSIEHHNKALEIRLRIYKEPHAETAASYNNLGFVYEKTEAYNKSLQLYFTAYNMDKAVYGEKHAMTAKSLNSLGSIYLKLRNYERAMECQTKALEIRKTVFGEKHADTATSYINLGILHMNMRDYEKSLGYHFKALNILTLLYHGENHSDIANAYNNIGLVHQKMEEYGKSLEFLLKAVELYKSIHGEQHSDTAASYSEVGSAYHNLEDHHKALEYHLKALEILVMIYGEHHSEVAASCINLGCVYESLKEYKKALEYHLKGLELYKEIHGENHEYTAASHDYLGLMYKGKGEYQQALEHLGKALEIRTLIYKEKSHPSIASSFNNIGIVYKNLGDYNLSMKNHEKALEVRKEIFGEKHPETAISYNHLGLVYKNLGNYEKSLEYHLKALEIREASHRDGDSDVADSCHNIGFNYFNQGNHEKSLEYLIKAQNINQRIYGDNHPVTLGIISEINFVLSQLGKR